MSKKAKKLRPVRAAPAKSRYKEYMVAKFNLRGRCMGPVIAGRRKHVRLDRRYVYPVWINPTDMQILYYVESTHLFDTPPIDRTKGFQCGVDKQCLNHGYGPMLRTIVWDQHFKGLRFACEPCMRRTLGRPLGPYDLRDCKMNHYHPAFQPHGMR